RKDYLSIGGRFGNRTSQRDSELDYERWTQQDTLRHFFRSIADRERSGAYYAMNMSYQHRFARKKHELTADISFRYGDSDEVTTNELRSHAGG
ncbi:MAG: hypothetical protein GWN00_08115, partial [Aliifodinibius sp.]|nr:hypothetical protein [Fodinibius sp.]NIX02315.1 hypothetical protein [Phycisphaerae bacterium]NIY24773.1 hypothetical protein [Fodinibius sp.]